MIDIRTMTNQHPDFYALMGPFLARREIEKEVGGRMYDDDGKQWFVATDEGRVVGFCAGIMRKENVHYASAYVVSGFRRKGVYRALCTRRDEFYQGVPAVVTCRKENIVFLRSLGFKLKRKKGSFSELHRQ